MRIGSLKFQISGILVALCCQGTVMADSGSQMPKSDSLKYLQDLRTQNVRRLQEIDQSLTRKIEESVPTQIETDVAHLKQAKKEHVLRQEFLDRLIFQVDTKFRGGDMKAFLERTLVDMAKVDAVGTGESGLWKFLRYASDAVRRLPEQRENILSFLEGYMNRSVANPVKPDDYISSRNYSNGAKSESGSPMAREEVGAVADRRLQELEQQQAASEIPTE